MQKILINYLNLIKIVFFKLLMWILLTIIWCKNIQTNILKYQQHEASISVLEWESFDLEN